MHSHPPILGLSRRMEAPSWIRFDFGSLLSPSLSVSLIGDFNYGDGDWLFLKWLEDWLARLSGLGLMEKGRNVRIYRKLERGMI